jgi:hypothetical protein
LSLFHFAQCVFFVRHLPGDALTALSAIGHAMAQVFTFSKKSVDSILQVHVWDADTLSNDLLGTAEINLDSEVYCSYREDLVALPRGKPFQMMDTKTGKINGIVELGFAACVLLVKVHR